MIHNLKILKTKAMTNFWWSENHTMTAVMMATKVLFQSHDFTFLFFMAILKVNYPILKVNYPII